MQPFEFTGHKRLFHTKTIRVSSISRHDFKKIIGKAGANLDMKKEVSSNLMYYFYGSPKVQYIQISRLCKF